MPHAIDIVLASQSPYRRQQLEQLAIPFHQQAADIDETPHPSEMLDDYVSRLAQEKAQKVAREYPDSWIIGSDQAGSVDGVIRSKPGDRDKAIKQLQDCRGKTVRFTTAVALVNQQKNRGQCKVEHFDVNFRHLTDEEIEHYVDLEKPFDCAGSFKVEGLGIYLFESLNGRDFNSLIGLPLIALVDLFHQQDINLLTLAQLNK